jgi:hypothetical protein
MQPSSSNNNQQVLGSLFDELCNPDSTTTQKQNAQETLISTVQSNNVSLNEAIQALGPYLVQTDERIRTRAYASLNHVLSSLSTEQVTNTPPQAIVSLFRFFGDRLDDYECISDILACVHTAMFLWKNSISDESLTYILSQFVSEVNVQSLNQKVRSMAFDIYDFYLLYRPACMSLVILYYYHECINYFISVQDRFCHRIYSCSRW